MGAACAPGEAATPATSINPATTDAAATTTPTTTPVGADDDPALVDWAAIVADLDRRRAAAQRDPSIEAVGTFCAPSSPCDEQWFDSIGFLVDNDLRMVGGQPDEVAGVTYAGTLDESPFPDAFEVVLDVERIATEQGVVRLVTGDGTVEQELRPDDDTPPGTRIIEAVVLQRQTLTSDWLVFEAG
jgi:hypothetical protein